MPTSPLPIELLELISSFCSQDTLRSLRLTSHKCCTAADRYMHFRLVTHSSTSSDLANIASKSAWSANCRELFLRCGPYNLSPEDFGHVNNHEAFKENVGVLFRNCTNLDTITLVVADAPGPEKVQQPSDGDHACRIVRNLAQASNEGDQWSPRCFQVASDSEVRSLARYSRLGYNHFFRDTEEFNWIFRGLRQESFRFADGFAGVLKQATSVQSMHFASAVVGRNHPFLSLSDVLDSSTTWPHLTCLSLAGMETDSEFMVDLLLRHSSTLQTLMLREMELYYGDWRDCFVRLSEQLPALRKVLLSGIFVPCGLDLVNFGQLRIGAKSETPGEEEWKNYGGQIFEDDAEGVNSELASKLEHFIIHGGDCPIQERHLEEV